MTLDLEALVTELEKNKRSIDDWVKKSQDAASDLRKHVGLLVEPEKEKLDALEYPGARPLEPGGLVKSYERTWEDREGAVAWVDSILSAKAVAASDGSQIYPTKEMFLAIAVIQSGLVLNRHGSKDYENRTAVKLLSPDDFGQEGMLPKHRDEMVDAFRFEMECESLTSILREEPGVTALLDGSLVLSHIQSAKEEAKQAYLRAVTELLGVAQETGNLLGAYIDLSKSTDLACILSHLLGNGERARVWDVQLLSGSMAWGDRTKAFLCDRDDRWGKGRSALDLYGQYRDSVGFFYLQLNNELPSRVEFPAWIYEQGRLDELADIIRAEVLIKGDYPDILYRAHNLAVIKEKEKEVFLQMVRGLLAGGMGVSSKEIYKSAGGL